MQRFQISEDDLSALEQTLPELAEALVPHLDNRLRVQIRRVQKILTDVRWRYGPPAEVEILPADQTS